MRFRILLSILILAALSACGHDQALLKPEIANVQKFYGVSLKPMVHPTDPDKSSVEVKSKAQGWKKQVRGVNRKNGYVGFDVDETGWIFFGVKGEDMGNTCSVGPASAEWVISKISLSATGDVNSEKGSNFGSSQSAYPWLQEAFPAVSLANGVIYDENAPGAAPASTFQGIFNANATEEEVQIFYEVSLRECAADPTDPLLKTDPMLGNGGRR